MLASDHPLAVLEQRAGDTGAAMSGRDVERLDLVSRSHHQTDDPLVCRGDCRRCEHLGDARGTTGDCDA